MGIAVETRDRNAVHFNDIGQYTSVYKFISLRGDSLDQLKSTLLSCTLDGSNPEELNDPFESNPYLVDDINENTIRNACKYLSKTGAADISDEWLEKGVDAVKRKLERFVKSTRRNARVISFCKRVDSQLLWAHYANSHKGVCLHFSSGAFSAKGIRRGSVEYRTQRPSLLLSMVAKLALPTKNTLNTSDRISLRKELYGSMFFSKPLDWQYEEEFRIIRSTAGKTPISFNKDGMLEIIFGERTSTKDRKRIRKMVDDTGHDVMFRQARISPSNFSVDVVPISDV